MLRDSKVLVAGGSNANGALASAELYDPTSGSWTATGSLATGRYSHTATLLPNGKVLVVGGVKANSHLASAELYDPASGTNGTWTTSGDLGTARSSHTATLLPNGKVLIAGGHNAGGSLASAELYNPATGTWTATGSLNAERGSHTATLLANGQMLVAGGDNSGSSRPNAELYDPANGSWTATGGLTTARDLQKGILLSNGKVLVAGGRAHFSASLASAELYDPAGGTWSPTGSLAIAREGPSATLLPNGKVLVAGGFSEVSNSYVASAELYDPASGTWTTTGSLITARYQPTATLLPNGRVLVTGGYVASNQLASAELYDPASGTWTMTGSLATARFAHAATLLPNGKVLVAGGARSNVTFLKSAEVYDPATGAWTATGSFSIARSDSSITVLPNGKVLLAGGFDGTRYANTDLYDPAGGTWIATGSLANARYGHTATLLPNGKVLVAAGFVSSGSLPSAELYDVGLGFNSAWQPQIATAPSILSSSHRLMLTGSFFQGISQASGGNYQDSSSNYPVVQLRRLDSSQVAYLVVDPTAGWSDTAFTSLPVSDFPFGPALVTVFTNGIPSAAKYLLVAPPSTFLNVSTRLRVLTGDNVLIGSFIITGTEPKKVLLRGIGPSLTAVGVTLFDPTMELHQGSATLATNDNWKINDQTQQSQEADIRATTIPPTNDMESAIVMTLNPGTYTTILAGKNGGAGVGLVEIYDLTPATDSKVANISTRGFVDTGDNQMIGGFILGGGGKVVIRAVGPSLTKFGIGNPLANPTLELHNRNGALVATNDNWKIDDQTGQSQEAEVRATTIEPSNDLESAIVSSLVPDNYTAIVRGKENGTGIGLVEVYNLE